MHLESISNGFGSQSMSILILRKRGIVRGDISMSADTGSENDCLWNTGRRTDARTYCEEVIVPYCKEIGIKCAFIRTLDKYGKPLPPLHEAMILHQEGRDGATPSFVPVFGSQGGRIRQACTDKWKLRAMSQHAKRLGAKTMRSAIGLHCEELGRVSGRLLGKSKLDGFNTFQNGFEEDGKFVPIKWQTKFYPLIDLKMTRKDCRNLCEEEGIPYIVSSQCDMCPHKDRGRWERSSPETREWAAGLEQQFSGNFFLSDKRIPLQMAIPTMTKPDDDQNDFGCQNDQCGL